jgi:hypothetical protein
MALSSADVAQLLETEKVLSQIKSVTPHAVPFFLAQYPAFYRKSS